MSNATSRTTVLLTAFAGLLLAPMGAAQAQTTHDQDARGDVVQLADSGKDATPVPDQVTGDITRTRLRYDATISVVAHFADLKRAGMRGDFLQIVTDKGLHRQAVLLSQAGDWSGTTSFTTFDGDDVACAGITHAVDYKANTVRMGVPRSCLSDPRWVRLGFGSSSVTDLDTGSFTFDDALQHGPVTDDDANLRLSGHLARTE